MGEQVKADERCQQNFGLSEADGWVVSDLAGQRKWDLPEEKLRGSAEGPNNFSLRDNRNFRKQNFRAGLRTGGQVARSWEDQFDPQIPSKSMEETKSSWKCITWNREWDNTGERQYCK